MKQAAEDKVIAAALQIIEKRFTRHRFAIESAIDVADYFRLKLNRLDREEFAVLFLDAKHRVIASEVMSRGTINHCAVYPREIGRMALRHNAAAVVLAHNHPSGDPEPSLADTVMTSDIIQALMLLGVQVVDHVVVGGAGHVSLAERKMLYRRDQDDTARTQPRRRRSRRQKVA